jgi:hypothetical protein
MHQLAASIGSLSASSDKGIPWEAERGNGNTQPGVSGTLGDSAVGYN